MMLLQKEEARWYPLRDHPVQLALVDAVSSGIRFPVVPAGRRCLELGTLVATPNGPVAIELLRVGDLVIGFNGEKPEITTVLESHINGRSLVTPLISSNHKYLSATENHRLLACKETSIGKYEDTFVADINKRYRVRRCYFPELIDNKGRSVKFTYALGALLSNGCSRDNKIVTGQYHRNINISAPDHIVPEYISNLLGCSFKKNKGDNCTYSIVYGQGVIDIIPFYKEWCSGRYSHEKTALWEEINTWDKESCLRFLAGIIDTDGSIYYKNSKKKEAVISIGMQALSVIECCANIAFKYFQERMLIHQDRRDKYVNGSVYYIKTTSNLQVVNMLREIDKYLVRKRDFDISTLVIKNVLPDRIGLTKGEPYPVETYDITVANNTNLYCLHEGGIVTHNSGKTERFKRFLSKQAMLHPGEAYFAGAPTRDQAKRIFWNDLKLMTFSSTHRKPPSETELKIFLPNDTTISVLGLDEPKRIEGVEWTGGGIDEIADLKPESLEANIMPALNTVNPTRPNYRAWCWFLGVPDGLNHYYDMAEYARTSGDRDWGLYHWKSSEILPESVIESAKRTMSRKQYQQEYEASFETASGRIYDEYGAHNHCQDVILPHEQLLWFHDFNYTPLSSGIGVRRGNSFYLLDEIILISAISKQSALEFVEKFKNHQNKNVLLYGDPAGRAGEKHGHQSDYTEMESILREYGWKVERRVRMSTRSIKDGQNAVRAKILNAKGETTLFVNPKSAPWVNQGLSRVQLKEGSTFLEDDSDQYQHITTAVRYMIDYECPVLGAGGSSRGF